MAVITALKFDDGVAGSETAGQADRAHSGFGTGVTQPHQLHGRNQLLHPARHDGFQGGGSAKTQAVGGSVLDGADYRRMGMAGDHRSPGAHVIDVAATILVVQIGALTALEENRRAADAAKSADR